MNAAIGLKESARAKVLAVLDPVLADEYVLYTKTRNFHWNVVGPHFNDMHKFFEAQYGILDGHVDAVAERSRALGGRALGSLKELARPLVTLWVINRQRDSLDLLSEYLDLMPGDARYATLRSR